MTAVRIAGLTLLDSGHVRGLTPAFFADRPDGMSMHLLCLDEGALRRVEWLVERFRAERAEVRVVDARSSARQTIAHTILNLDADYVQLGFDPFRCEPQSFDLFGQELRSRPADVISFDYMVERAGVVHHRATSLAKRDRSSGTWEGSAALAIDLSAHLVSARLVRDRLAELLALPLAAHWWRLALPHLLPELRDVQYWPLMGGLLQNDGPLAPVAEIAALPETLEALLSEEHPLKAGTATEWVLAMRCCADLQTPRREGSRDGLLARSSGGLIGPAKLAALFDALHCTGITDGELSPEELHRVLDEAVRVEIALNKAARWASPLVSPGEWTTLQASLVQRVLRAEQEASQWRAIVADLQGDLFVARRRARNWKERFLSLSGGSAAPIEPR